MFFYNVFNDDQIAEIKKDINSKIEKNDYFYSKVWYGQMMNAKERYLDEHGDIMVSQVSSHIKNFIKKILLNFDKTTRHYDFNALYQIWDRNSGCGLHKDSPCPFVATFYLNEIWSPNDGGLYVYEEENQYKIFVPKHNSCNFNLRGQYGLHCVTPITPYALDKRYTIQVFGKE